MPYGPKVTSDGSGGAIVAYEDIKRGNQHDFYVQKISPEGDILWGDKGVLIGSGYKYWDSFHDLRHTFVSLMLLRGAKPKVISEALGHASVGFTMDVYSHIIEGMQADAMALLDEVLPEGVVKNSVAHLSPTSAFMSTKS